MHDLYAPEAYFARMDALYLDDKLLPALGRRRYLRRHPWRWLRSRAWATVETLFVFVQLMRFVPDKQLRASTSFASGGLIRRPHITLLRLYCVKCALHFHADRLVSEMLAQRAALVPVNMDNDSPGSEVTASAAA